MSKRRPPSEYPPTGPPSPDAATGRLARLADPVLAAELVELAAVEPRSAIRRALESGLRGELAPELAELVILAAGAELGAARSAGQARRPPTSGSRRQEPHGPPERVEPDDEPQEPAGSFEARLRAARAARHGRTS